MKSIKAGVNTTRVHWLVEELQSLGIQDIIVTEHFKPLSQISRMVLVCEDDKVAAVKKIIHKIGTCGNAVDHYVFVDDYINLPSANANISQNNNLFYPKS